MSKKKESNANEKENVVQENVFDNPEAAVEKSGENLVVFEGDEVAVPVEVELTQEDQELLTRVDHIVKGINDTYWELSEKIAIINSKRLYKGLKYATFEAYLQDRLGWERRKGYFFVQIHNYFSNELRALLAGDQDTYNYVVSVAKEIGWTKALMLAKDRVLTTENAREVMEKAKSCSVKDLGIVCKTYFEEMTDEEKQDAIADNIIKTVRLNFQCTLPQKEDINDAVDTAQTSIMKEGATKSGALALICRDWFSGHQISKGKKIAIAEYLSAIERYTGLSLVAIDEGLGKIVYGEDSLRDLAKSEAIDQAPDCVIGSDTIEASVTQ